MKIGVEANHLPSYQTDNRWETLALVQQLGFDGVFFKTALDLSPTLDQGELAGIKQYADELGLFLDCGVGRVNPYNTPESPEVRAVGDGDYRLGIERIIHAARTIDCVHLWGETATSANKPYPGLFKIDRFRTDVSWQDQLLATEKFLKMLAPLLRDIGSRICLETHEEITSYEVVRLVEAVGPDVMGITFDTGNVVVRGEEPLAAARRVAPYTHLTHLKDPLLTFDAEGLMRYIYPCGLGAVDWTTLLAILGEHAPYLHLYLEDHKGVTVIPIYNTFWQQMHPDLNVTEVAALFQLAYTCERRIVSGEIPVPATYETIPYNQQWQERLQASVTHLRQIITELHLGTMQPDGHTADATL